MEQLLNDIEIYMMVRKGSLNSFPSEFWKELNEHRENRLIQYLFDYILDWSEEDIKNKLNSKVFVDNKLGRVLKTFFNNNPYLAIATLYPKLKEWCDSKYCDIETKHKLHYEDSQLIDILQNKTKELGRIPIQKELKNPCTSVYRSRFGSWDKALINAGLLEDIYKDVDISEEAKQNTINVFKEIAFKNQRLPLKAEIDNMLSEGELKSYFKSYSNLTRVLTYEYSENELKDMLRKKQEQLGRIPTNYDIHIPYPIVFIDKFGSWEKAVEESGIT